jgi:hypothetical protein
MNRNFNESKFDKKIFDLPELYRFYPFTDGHGVHPDLNKLSTFPQKIALISFNVWDNSLVLLNKSPEDYWNDKNWINEDENFVAFAMHHYGIDNLKYIFDSVGCSLITPDGFSVSQKRIYDSFEISYSKNFRKYVSDSINFNLCAAPGYLFIKNPIDKSDYLACNALGILAKLLGVDAVLIVENNISSALMIGILNNIEFSLYGLNPNVANTSKNICKGMHFLTSKAVVDATFFEFNKNKIFESYACYDKIIHCLSKHFIEEFNVRKSIKAKIY